MPTIQQDDPTREDVQTLIREHLADMFATSPAESVHALDVSALAAPDVTFFTAREEDTLLGCGALKTLSPTDGELKSMRTTPAARGRGIGTLMLGHLLDEGRRRGYRTVHLETGTQDFFAPARRLYEQHGFVVSPPFGGYTEDPFSVYYVLELT